MRYLLILIILTLCISAYSAEFLIYNKDHWMDALTPTQLAEYIKKYPNFQAKYDARYQRGDIVEVRPDGFYTSTLKGDLSRWAFRVLVVKDLSFEQAQKYTQPIVGNTSAFNGLITLKRRRYNIQDGVAKTVHTVTKMENITLIDKTLSANESEKLLIIIARIMLLNLVS